jgi:hypothetical protein
MAHVLAQLRFLDGIAPRISRRAKQQWNLRAVISASFWGNLLVGEYALVAISLTTENASEWFDIWSLELLTSMH